MRISFKIKLIEINLNKEPGVLSQNPGFRWSMVLNLFIIQFNTTIGASSSLQLWHYSNLLHDIQELSMNSDLHRVPIAPKQLVQIWDQHLFPYFIHISHTILTGFLSLVIIIKIAVKENWRSRWYELHPVVWVVNHRWSLLLVDGRMLSVWT